MAVIKPFQAVRYNTKKVNIKKVVSPPYDVISKEEQNKLYKNDPNNIVRLILGKESKADTKTKNKYTRASDFFNIWQKRNILSKDENPSLYVYRQDFTKFGKAYSRVGFLTLLKLEPFFKGTVYPHERTLSKPKADRLSLMRTCDAQFSPIFGMYDDKGKRVSSILRSVIKKKPMLDFSDCNKERNRLWLIQDEKMLKNITKNMADKKIFIADGHHRYETALAFSKERKNVHSKFVLSFLCDMNDKGLAVFPTHRLVKLNGMREEQFFTSLEKYFTISLSSRQKIEQHLQLESRKKNIAIGVFTGKKWYLLVLKNKATLSKIIKGSKAYRELDLAVLESIIFKKILKFSDQDIALQKYLKYVKNMEDSVKLIKQKKFDIACIMNIPKVEDIKRVALAGETMPQKSTFFYPKLLTGMVIHKLTD